MLKNMSDNNDQSVVFFFLFSFFLSFFLSSLVAMTGRATRGPENCTVLACFPRLSYTPSVDFSSISRWRPQTVCSFQQRFPVWWTCFLDGHFSGVQELSVLHLITFFIKFFVYLTALIIQQSVILIKSDCIV